MMLLHALFIVFALVLFCYIVVNERRSKSRVPYLVRCTAGLLAIGALTGLLFPLSYPSSWSFSPNSDELAIFTRGTPETAIDISVRNSDAVTTDSIIARKFQIPLIEDWEAFLQQYPHTPFAVHGFGLTPYQLKALDGHPIRYHAPEQPHGFIFGEWPLQLPASTPLVMHGQYNNPSEQEAKVILLSAAQPVDSAIIPPQSTHPFTLTCHPKQLGNNLFSVLAIAGQDTLQHEKLPVTIRPSQPLHVVMLAASPSFEYKFLTNWFQQLHYGTAFRARISTGKFSFSYSEASSTSLAYPLGESTFKHTDLLIADEAELAACSRHEQQVIAEAVRSGMGLLLFIHDGKTSSLLGKQFRASAISTKHEQGVTMRSAAKKDYPRLPVSALSTIQINPSQRPLLYHNEQVVAASQLYGKGFVTAMTISNSYIWWLRNQQASYAQFWSFLLDNTAAGRRQNPHYVQTPRFPTAHKRTDLSLQHPDTPISIDGTAYPLLQHESLPDFFQLSFWPRRTGWHSMEVPQGDSTWFYVYDNSDWQAAKDFAAMQAMESFVTENSKKRPEEARNKSRLKNEVPKWLFFLLFLIAASILWYASRQYNQNVM